MTFRIPFLAAALVVALAAPAVAAPPLAQVAGPETLCGEAIARQERLYGLPSQLLQSISLVESGRWSDERRESIAWPWTVTAGGPGKFFPTKAAAIAEVRRLQAEGVRNIDVGCMQINMLYHPDAFASLEDAFDPASNAAYAAEFLARLNDSTGTWLQAAAFYHSQEPTRAAAYRQKVTRHWEERKLVAAASVRGQPATPPAGTLKPEALAALPPAPGPVRVAKAAQPSPAELAAAAAMRRSEQKEKLAAEAAEAARAANAWREARLRQYEARKRYVTISRN